MLDLWEVFGRLASDKTFFDNLCAACSSKYYPLAKDVGWLSGKALNIPEKAYQKLHKALAPVVTGPVSLMALGELLMVFSSPKFRSLAAKLVREIEKTHVNTSNRTKLFYTALGCMVLDDTVRSDFANRVYDRNGFGALTEGVGGLPGEQDDLASLADPEKKVMIKANDLCRLFWHQGCCDQLNFYTGHVHILAQPMPKRRS